MTSSEERLEITSLSTAVLVLLLVVWALLGSKLRNGVIPLSAIAALLGLTTGIVILLFHEYLSHAVVKKLLVFDSSAFLVYLLPPVIFNAGLGVHKKLFFGNLGTILCMGIIGTVASFLIITFFLSALAGLRILRFQDCLALGAIFSATDSVATLQVLDSDTMPLLFAVVFGEGIINDATSVVLFGAVSRVFPPTFNVTSPFAAAPMAPMAGNATDSAGNASSPGTDADAGGNHDGHELGLVTSFLYLYTTSTVLGLATGLAITYLLQHVNAAVAHREMVLVGMLSYLSYLAAELFGLSGILCLFCCGIAVSHWALPKMSPLGSSCTSEAFHALSHLAEGVIFIYVGMDALDPIKWEAAYLPETIPLCFTLVLLLFISRALGVLPVALLHNLWGSQPLTWRDLAIIWWSGLMRGAVSVALVYSYFDSGSQNLDAHHATIISSTLVIVLFTTVVMGVLTKPFLALLLEDEPDKALRAMWTQGVSKILVPWRRVFGYQAVAAMPGQEQAASTDVVEISMQQQQPAAPVRDPEEGREGMDPPGPSFPVLRSNSRLGNVKTG